MKEVDKYFDITCKVRYPRKKKKAIKKLVKRALVHLLDLPWDKMVSFWQYEHPFLITYKTKL